MKLRNKETGEIVDSEAILFNCFNSLAELNEKWEDVVEEPKTGWYLTSLGTPIEMEFGDNDCRQGLEAIGNYFETKEEAEKAVEKLKAWKRLKDKGIEFYGWRKNPTGTYDFLARWRGIPPKMHDIINDLDLLFGGEGGN